MHIPKGTEELSTILGSPPKTLLKLRHLYLPQPSYFFLLSHRLDDLINVSFRIANGSCPLLCLI